MPDPKMTIRPFGPDDREPLSAIWLAASRRAHGFLGEERLLRQQQLVAEHYLPGADTRVAVLDGQTVGFIGLLDNFIGGLFVAPEIQGAGVGRALVVHGTMLKGPLELEVYDANQGAGAFYARLGFAVIGHRETDDEGLPFPLTRLRGPESFDPAQ